MRIATQNSERLMSYLFIFLFLILALVYYQFLGRLPTYAFPSLLKLIIGLVTLTVIFTYDIRLIPLLIPISIIFSPNVDVGNISGRSVNLRIEDIVILSGLFSLFLRRIMFGSLEILSIRTPLDKPILAFILVSLVSTSVGALLGNISVARYFFFFAKRVEYFVLFYLIYFCINSEKQNKYAIIILILCGVGISVYSFYNRSNLETVSYSSYAQLVPFVKRGISDYGPTFNLILPILISTAITMKSPIYTAFAAFASIPVVIALMDTMQRVSYIGTMVSLLFLAIYKYRSLIILFILGIYYSIGRLSQNFIQRASFLWEEIIHYPHPYGSLPYRVAGVMEAFRNILYRPLIGKGLGTYSLGAAVSHNQYAQLLLETGILGLGTFLWFIFNALKTGFHMGKVTSNKLYRGFCYGYIAGVIGWLVACLGTINFTSIRSMEVFIVATAIVISGCKEDIFGG
ncbi:hypothetical protein GF312_10790 [Candidatus Poribacteria bacterium]|nr:hypothetical protein [Candidatus Poribacteria bacterium]